MSAEVSACGFDSYYLRVVDDGQGVIAVAICECGGMVDTLVLETSVARRVGSTPSTRTNYKRKELCMTSSGTFTAWSKAEADKVRKLLDEADATYTMNVSVTHDQRDGKLVRTEFTFNTNNMLRALIKKV